MLNYSEVEEAPDCLRVNQGGPSVTPHLRGSFAQAGGLGAGPGMAGSETPRLGGLGAECSDLSSGLRPGGSTEGGSRKSFASLPMTLASPSPETCFLGLGCTQRIQSCTARPFRSTPASKTMADSSWQLFLKSRKFSEQVFLKPVAVGSSQE